VADIHATILTALGVDLAKEVITPVKRPIKFTQGQPLAKLLS
jgi:hypothetical protein